MVMNKGLHGLDLSINIEEVLGLYETYHQRMLIINPVTLVASGEVSLSDFGNKSMNYIKMFFGFMIKHIRRYMERLTSVNSAFEARVSALKDIEKDIKKRYSDIVSNNGETALEIVDYDFSNLFEIVTAGPNRFERGLVLETQIQRSFDFLMFDTVENKDRFVSIVSSLYRLIGETCEEMTIFGGGMVHSRVGVLLEKGTEISEINSKFSLAIAEDALTQDFDSVESSFSDGVDSEIYEGKALVDKILDYTGEVIEAANKVDYSKIVEFFRRLQQAIESLNLRLGGDDTGITVDPDKFYGAFEDSDEAIREFKDLLNNFNIFVSSMQTFKNDMLFVGIKSMNDVIGYGKTITQTQ